MSQTIRLSGRAATGQAMQRSGHADAHEAAARRARPAAAQNGAARPQPRTAIAASQLAPMARLGRRPETHERLHRLRRELAQINPACASPDEAREEILLAMARAGLDGWTVPPLDDPAARRCADGSVCVRLVSHWLVLNTCGAFRIIDQRSPRVPYFEKAGRDEQRFLMPADLELGVA